MSKPKLYCFFTPSHKVFFENYLKPSAEEEYDINPIFHEEQISQSGEYREIGWRETQYNKVLAWKKASDENYGESILCCDVDIQFFGKTFQKLKSFAEGTDITFQENDLKGKICSGFFICNCSEKTSAFFQEVADRLKKIMNQKGGGEQYTMQQIIDEDSSDCIIRKFPRNIVWNPGVRYSHISDLKIPNDILVHHANWCVGDSLKIEQLNYVKGLKNTSHLKYEPISKKENKSKIALCLSSLIRFFDIAHESIIENIIKSLPCKPDLFGHFPLQSQSKENIEYLKKIESYCLNSFIKFEEDELNEKYLNFNKNMNGHQRNGVKGNLLQWVSMKEVRDLKIKNEEFFNEDYEWVIWARPDLYYFNSLDNIFSLKDADIFFPAHDNHFCGIFDRFCIGRSKIMDKRMDIFNYFVEKWYPLFKNDESHLYYNLNAKKYQWNPELVLKDYLNDELKIKHKKLNLCSGKIREGKKIRVPFWHEVQGNGNPENMIPCEEDIVNPSVLKKIYDYDNTEWDEKGAWFHICLD